MLILLKPDGFQQVAWGCLLHELAAASVAGVVLAFIGMIARLLLL